MKHLLPAVQRTALRIPWAAVGGCAAALLLTAAAPGGAFAPGGGGGGAGGGGAPPPPPGRGPPPGGGGGGGGRPAWDGRACWRWSVRGWAPCCLWTFSRGCGIPPRRC